MTSRRVWSTSSKLNDAGNLVPVDVTPATIESGQTPVVMDWDYLNAAETKALPSWKVFVPENAVVGGYYFQAINADAPHPNAARLWQEFLYSDEGQNLWLAGGARPVRADAMVKAGTIDQAAYDALPPVTGTPVFPTVEQSEKATAYSGRQLGQRGQLTVALDRRRIGASLGLAPFLAYVTIFLIIPTIVVIVNAFVNSEGAFTMDAVNSLKSEANITATKNTVILSLETAIFGALVGALVAYVVSTGNPERYAAQVRDERQRRTGSVRRCGTRLRLHRHGRAARAS